MFSNSLSHILCGTFFAAAAMNGAPSKWALQGRWRFAALLTARRHGAKSGRLSKMEINHLPSWLLKIDGSKMYFLFKMPIFRGYVSFREDKHPFTKILATSKSGIASYCVFDIHSSVNQPKHI